MVTLVCGGREWLNYWLTFQRVRYWHQTSPITLLIHGGCRGADERGGRAADELSIPTIVYPAQWDRDGLAAGPIRNQYMLDMHPEIDLVLAFHEDIKSSKGTRDMVRRALKKGVLVELARRDEIVFPYEGE